MEIFRVRHKCWGEQEFGCVIFDCRDFFQRKVAKVQECKVEMQRVAGGNSRYNRILWMRGLEKGGVLGFDFGLFNTFNPRSTPPCVKLTVPRWSFQPPVPKTY